MSVIAGQSRCFISYKRERAAEVKTLVLALREVGVPAWQDVDDLGTGPTPTELRRVLESDEISAGILFITPEVKGSAVILEIEAPLLVRRAGRNHTTFPLIPVAAGGLNRQQAKDIFAGQPLDGQDLSQWDMPKINTPIFSAADARAIAKRALKERLRVIAAMLPADEPLVVGVYDNNPVAHDPAHALTVDWSHLVNKRHYADGAVDNIILPAIKTLADAISNTPGLIERPLHFTGNLYLPLAVALGVEFRAVRRFQVTWRQYTPGAGTSEWGNHIDADDSRPLTAQIKDGTPGVRDLAVLVGINDDPQNDFDRVRPMLPPIGAALHLAHRDAQGNTQRVFLTPAQARYAVDTIVREIRQIRDSRQVDGIMHLFLAAPAGLAVMLGQKLNTLGQVVVYQHDKCAGPPYFPAAVLHPSC